MYMVADVLSFEYDTLRFEIVDMTEIHYFLYIPSHYKTSDRKSYIRRTPGT